MGFKSPIPPQATGKEAGELDTKLKALMAKTFNIVNWPSDESAYTEEKKPQLRWMLKRQGEVAGAIGDVEWHGLATSEKLEAIRQPARV